MQGREYTGYKSRLSVQNRVGRALWMLCSFFFFRPFAGRVFNRWRIFLLRRFGAQIGKNCQVYATVRIWAPWNLTLGDYVALGPRCECYSADKITIGSMVTVSQDAYLCTASHDIGSIMKPLITKPIVIESYCWVCARVFVGPGVVMHEGSVAGACAVVTKSAEPWSVVGGNPAKVIKKRVIRDEA